MSLGVPEYNGMPLERIADPEGDEAVEETVGYGLLLDENEELGGDEFEDPGEEGSVNHQYDTFVDSLPPQLHPAVSLGMKRVSSCYFSIASSEASASAADLLQLLDDTERFERSIYSLDERRMNGAGEWFDEDDSETSHGDRGEEQVDHAASLTSVKNGGSDADSDWNQQKGSVVNFLHHDIMMKVFTYLDAPSLSAFSETARQPNFEVFYFLQLQLEKALLIAPSPRSLKHLPSELSKVAPDVQGADYAAADDSSLAAIAGSGSVSRLAGMDMAAAHGIVQEFLDSNSTLHTMPLSHSLAYIHQLLHRNGFQNHVTKGSPSSAMASAAFLVTVVGAASYMSGSSDLSASLPNALFRVGLAGGLVRAGVSAREAARKRSGDDDDDDHHIEGDNDQQLHRTMTMRETAEQMARMVQEQMPESLRRALESESQETTMTSPSVIAATLYKAFCAANGIEVPPSPTRRTGGRRKRSKSKRSRSCEEPVEGNTASEALALGHQQLTPNPYEHPPLTETQEENIDSDSDDEPAINRKMPSGSVGAYSRSVRKASELVLENIKNMRKANFAALSEVEQQAVATVFVDSCSSDNNLKVVKKLVQERCLVDVDDFYVGSDGTETCALHTAAFHGATKILEFLCNGLDENSAKNDGGLCDIDLRDANGWTALHFAAGANSVEVIRILAAHGARLTIEAGNGYTPFHWAQRLGLEEAAQELERLGADNRFPEMRWIDAARRQPLSFLASQFFSLIPSH